MKKRTSVIISITLGIILIGLFLYKTNPKAILFHLVHLKFGWLMVALVFNILSVVLRSNRWRDILKPIKTCSFHRTMAATFMGYAFSTLLPARAGEIIRPLYLAGEEEISRVTALTSVAIERLMDLSVILILLAFYFILVPTNDQNVLLPTIRNTAVISMICLILLYFSAMIIIKKPACAEWIQSKITWNFLRSLFQNVLSGLSILQPGWALFWIIIQGFVIWLLIAAQNYCVFNAFSLNLPFSAAFLIITVSAAGFLVPSPGGVGGFHKSVQIGLTVFHQVEYNLASAYSLVLHALSMLPLTFIGLVYFFFSGMDYQKLVKNVTSDSSPQSK